MAEKERILAEIQKLITRQLEVLRGKLHVEEVARYAERKRRIDELLEQISKDGS